MIYTFGNKELKVEIKTKGAELMSVLDTASGCEYIWQGDAKYWEDRSPVCFPICSSFFEGKYTCNGKEYKMGLHGFAQHTEFSVLAHDATSLALGMNSSEITRESYPFDFEFIIKYTLVGRELICDATIKNTSDEIMPVSFGAHPGFNLPFTVGAGEFEDYYLEFSDPCTPIQMPLDKKTCFLTNERIPLKLENDRILRLRHEMFTPDGIFTECPAREVTLKGDCDERSVTVRYADMPYFGIWQEYGADTPFLCIEPWCAPPDNHGVPQDIFDRTAIFKLAAGEEKNVSYSIIFN